LGKKTGRGGGVAAAGTAIGKRKIKNKKRERVPEQRGTPPEKSNGGCETNVGQQGKSRKKRT